MTTAVATKYTVKAGDSLSSIAKRFGSSVAVLARVNHIVDINKIRIGQVLVIPAGGTAPALPRPLQYIVKVGDTLSAIAARFHTTTNALARANHIGNPDRIRVGQVIKVVGTLVMRPTALSVVHPPPPAATGDLSRSQLLAIMPLIRKKADTYLPHLNAAMREAHITTPLRRAAFLAQLAHESLQLTAMEEFASGAEYEGRLDLGNIHPGDGRRYKGRGPIQLTGRSNYRAAGKALGLDLEGNPRRAADPDVGFRTAGWFWTTHGLNGLADQRKFDKITRRINGGLNGKTDRDRYYAIARRILRAG